jgi:hypothetical protein
MAFPDNMELESGTRANEGPPPSANWATGVYAADVGFNITSNKFTPVGGGNSSAVWLYEFNKPKEVWVDVDTFPATGFSFELYVNLLNYDTASPSSYVVRFWHHSGGGVGSLELDRLDSGSLTRLTDMGKTLVLGDQIGLENLNGSIRVYVNAVSQMSPNDNTYSGPGRLAIRHLGDNTTMRLSHFGGGNYVPRESYSRPKIMKQERSFA